MSQTTTTPRLRPRDRFTPEQIAELTARSNLRGARMVLSPCVVIGACFAVLAIWPSVWTFGVAVFVLGGRQLALAMLAHEAVHRLLFRTPGLNDMLRNTRTTRAGWLARLTVAPMHVNYHQEHHLMASVPCYRLPQCTGCCARAVSWTRRGVMSACCRRRRRAAEHLSQLWVPATAK